MVKVADTPLPKRLEGVGWYAKALAVKRVITNKGKKTPGIDGNFWATDDEKIRAVYELQTCTYKGIHVQTFSKAGFPGMDSGRGHQELF